MGLSALDSEFNIQQADLIIIHHRTSMQHKREWVAQPMLA
ncbi:hypothetical protein SSYIS1_11690 [Serratia symbiotica]|uniref:Uncharacterized protein n=1 Tax=Serratia symbiotica TaxID=138074 RepID=A0A455VP89_9GAMM|nr:hypothetical protein SSYIS1_11690 [Serratia symbiotica]